MELVECLAQTEQETAVQEWSAHFLGRICGRITTGRLDANAMVDDGDFPFFTCASEPYRIDTYAFDGEALLVSGNGANVGYVHYYKGKFNAYQRTYVLTGFEADVQFIKYYLERNLRERIRVEVNAGNTPYITMGTLTQMEVVLPKNLFEQQAIATALSDADAYIESLEQLITKKRQIKQGVMQELLTGERRLPGFPRQWEEKKLGEIAHLYQSETIPASRFTDNGYPVYGANGVVGFFSRYNHESWQVTVTCRGSTCGTVNRTVNRSWITGNAMVVNCDEINGIDKQFLFYLLSQQDLTKCISGTGQPQIVRAPLANFQVYLPADVEEQVAIGLLLADIDAEIDAQTCKLEKARHLKSAMMQQLLTGKIRLV
jgi:type I restriction enzyme S subunit